MFTNALPIWLKGKENEMNIQAKFKAEFIPCENAVLKITGATFFKVFLNGELVHYGPSSTASGYVRVDVVNLKVNPGVKNFIVIEAAGYNCYSYATVKKPSFVQAEILCGDKCIAATGFDFDALLVPSRIQKTMRYSFQRHFTEVWDLTKEDMPEEVSVIDIGVKYLDRKAPLPHIAPEQMAKVYSKDTLTKEKNDWQIPGLQGAIDNICDVINGFELNEISHRPIKELSEFNYTISENGAFLPCRLSKGEVGVFKCEKNTCGLINLKYKAKEKCRILIAFDEKLIDKKFDCKNWDVFNVIEVNSWGDTEFSNFEIYGFKYFAVFVLEGDLELTGASVTRIRNPIENPPKLNCQDEQILKIYNAALESARCNYLGHFMDCPTRERAGWLCDSYFSAQAAYRFSKNTLIEDDFVENFALAKCPELPKGMLPMCYPADHPNGNFIPQWAMWFILELNQYKDRNKKVSIDTYKALTYDLMNFFEAYENELGLLEDLPGWNFVEWSKANEWTKGVNFPTNMLYSSVCKIIGNWFCDIELISKSQAIKEKVLELSFDGKFFRDQALRNADNALIVQDNISEACQYYAFMFDIADTKSHTGLYETMVSDFAPESAKWEAIEKANALMGLYMRMELMLKWGHKEQLLKEVVSYFGHMSDITGTLWEHKYMSASLNHGFTAYLCVVLLEIFNK